MRGTEVMALVVKNSSANVGDIRMECSVLGLGQSSGGAYGNSSILAWRISWTEEPGRLLPMGSHRVRHDWSNLASVTLRHTLNSVQFSRSVVSDFLRPHGLQHTRLSCPSPTPRACSNFCLLSWWCHPTISSSVTLFSSHLQSFPASQSFQMSQFFTSAGQSTGVSALASVLPMNVQDWFPLGWIGWISLLSKGLSNTTVQKHQFLSTQLFFIVQLSHPYMTTGKTKALTRRTFVGKVTSLLFNMLSRLVITFLPRSKCLFISWLQSPSAVILKPKK